MGVLLNTHRANNRRIITSGGFETGINLVSATDPIVIIDTFGIVTFHNTKFDPETGMEVSARQVHALVSVSDLLSLNYPIFRSERLPDDPTLKDDIITFIDANDRIRVMRVTENRSSNTFGCISLFFEDFKE